jgi:hypothetical protein
MVSQMFLQPSVALCIRIRQVSGVGSGIRIYIFILPPCVRIVFIMDGGDLIFCSLPVSKSRDKITLVASLTCLMV